jgi:hypothetical protein
MREVTECTRKIGGKIALNMSANVGLYILLDSAMLRYFDCAGISERNGRILSSPRYRTFAQTVSGSPNHGEGD